MKEKQIKPTPRRHTRQTIAKILITMLVTIMAWLFFPGDIDDNEKAVAIALIGFASAYLMAFAGFETQNDVSERKHGNSI